MNYFTIPLLITLLIPLSSVGVQADTLLLDKIQNVGAINMPNRGENMDDVRRTFGEPSSIVAAVGEPPITRWVYKEYTVYFEHQLVITSVVNR